MLKRIGNNPLILAIFGVFLLYYLSLFAITPRIAFDLITCLRIGLGAAVAVAWFVGMREALRTGWHDNIDASFLAVGVWLIGVGQFLAGSYGIFFRLAYYPASAVDSAWTGFFSNITTLGLAFVLAAPALDAPQRMRLGSYRWLFAAVAVAIFAAGLTLGITIKDVAE